jgi:hypothetical protein
MLASAFAAALAAGPGELQRVESQWLKNCRDKSTLLQVRGCMYTVAMRRLEAQQRTNDRKRRQLEWAGRLFVLAGLCLAIDACTLAVTHWR